MWRPWRRCSRGSIVAVHDVDVPYPVNIRSTSSLRSSLFARSHLLPYHGLHGYVLAEKVLDLFAGGASSEVGHVQVRRQHLALRPRLEQRLLRLLRLDATARAATATSERGGVYDVRTV